MILPWGNKRDDNTQEGNMPGAPARSRIKQKFMITGAFSTVLWVIVFLLIHFEIVNFYDIAQKMVEEDYQ